MAFMRDIRRPCDRCNGKTATHEVVNNRNAPLGRFCGRCASAALRAQQAVEDAATDGRP